MSIDCEKCGGNYGICLGDCDPYRYHRMCDESTVDPVEYSMGRLREQIESLQDLIRVYHLAQLGSKTVLFEHSSRALSTQFYSIIKEFEETDQQLLEIMDAYRAGV